MSNLINWLNGIEKIGKDPAPGQGMYNAPSPDESISPSGQTGMTAASRVLGECKGGACVHFRAPSNLHGTKLHNITGDGPLHGQVVPRDGIVHAHESDTEMHEHLRAAGFRQMRPSEEASRMEGKALASIATVLKQGAAKAAVVDAILRRDPSRQLAMKTTPNGSTDVWAFFAKRNAANNTRDPIVPSEPARSPRDHYVERLIERGYSRLQAGQIARGELQP